MAFGLDESWVMSTPALPGAGELAYADTIGIPESHPLVGGDTWGVDGSGMQADSGFMRLVTEDTMSGTAAAGSGVRATLDTWQDVFNFRHSPTPWLLVALLVAIGFIHLRVNTRVGPAHAHIGLG